jgi:ABC-2 type transport system ATP-binding protein
VVLEKGNVIKDLETNPTTLKELEAHFASGAMGSQEEE